MNLKAQTLNSLKYGLCERCRGPGYLSELDVEGWVVAEICDACLSVLTARHQEQEP